jgi:hypothetical protein
MNIAYIHTPDSGKEREVHLDLTLEVVRPRQWVRILHQIQALANVFSVKSFPGKIRPDEPLPAKSFYRPE